MRYGLPLLLLIALSGCASERHFARDSIWPFGDPNAPAAGSETALRALGQSPDVTPIAPQAGNVWPGAVQPVPTIADIEQNMNQPLGQSYIPSLPSPYPPGQGPPPDSSGDLDQNVPPAAIPQIPPIAPSSVPPAGTVTPGSLPPGAVVPGVLAPIVPGNPHVRQ